MSMLGRMFGFGRSEHYDRGIRLFDQGLYEEAIGELNHVTAGTSGREEVLTQRLAAFYIAEAYANLGMAALQAQDHARAQEMLGHALDLNPHYADLHFHYGRASRKAGDPAAAIGAFERALQINPHFAKARLFLGLALYRAHRPEQALEQIRQAADLDRAYRTPPFPEAVIAHEAGDYRAAEGLFERVAETEVDDITFHASLGADLYRRGMFEQAAEEFRKALALNPGYADIRNNLGIALNALGRYDAAADEFRRALEINPRYVEARTNLALTLRAAGREEEAVAEFRRVLEQDPENVIALGHVTESARPA